MSRHRAIPALPVLAAIAAASGTPPAQAAESFDSCAGTIASLPAVISTQGVWCMQGDLSSASTSGNAITVTAAARASGPRARAGPLPADP